MKRADEQYLTEREQMYLRERKESKMTSSFFDLVNDASRWRIQEKEKVWQRSVVSFELVEVVPGNVNMELQREFKVGYLHLGPISIYLVMDATGVDEVNWGGTGSKTRNGSRGETLGEILFRVGKEKETPKNTEE